MNISTKYDLADVVYIKRKALEDHEYINAIIEKIIINVYSDVITVIDYQISSNSLFHNSIFPENELLTKEEADAIILEKLQEEKQNIVDRIEEIE